MTVHRRTFEAAQHPKGSPERQALNESAITSEYMTSYKYVSILNGSHLTFHTKGDAEAYEQRQSERT